MLVSAVLDPSAFDAACFDDKVYTIHAEDFLKGIGRNGLLIIDSDRRLQKAFVEQIESDPSKYGQRLPILAAELFKNGNKRVVAVKLNGISKMSFLDLAYHLKTETEADALIVADDNFLRGDSKSWEDLVPLSEYRESNFEKVRQEYETHNTPIDELPECEVKDFIIRSVRFSKRLRFYDPFIGRGGNTRKFRKGIEYILSLWNERGFFSHRTRSVEIFTCCEPQSGQSRNWWERKIQDQKRKINQELIEKFQFPSWSIKFWIKTDPNRIFHSRYWETEHAIIGVDPGFDFFIRDGEFKRTHFIPDMTKVSHLRECRNLPDASV